MAMVSSQNTPALTEKAGLKFWRDYWVLALWGAGLLIITLVLVTPVLWDQRDLRGNPMSIWGTMLGPLVTNSVTILIFWTTAALACYGFMKPDRPTMDGTSSGGLIRRRFLVVWLGGLIGLLTWGALLLQTLLPPLADRLTALRDPILVLLIWTAGIALAYLFIGDRTQAYQAYLFPYTGLWGVFILMLLAVVLVGYLAYQDVQRRVDATQAAAALARENANALREETAQIADIAARWSVAVDLYEQRGSARRNEPSPPQGEQKAATRLIDTLAADLPGLQTSLKNADAHARQARELIARELAESRQRTTNTRAQAALERSGAVLSDTSGLTAAMLRGVAPLGDDLEQIGLLLQSDPSQPLTTVLKSVAPLPEAANKATVQAQDAARTLAGLQADYSRPYLWIATFYAIFVLFPWLLTWLFIYRKRENRAGQILQDLIQLDPQGGLLRKIILLPGRSGPTESAPARATGPAKTGADTVQAAYQQLGDDVATFLIQRQIPPTEKPDPEALAARDNISRALGERTFNNFEYILSLIPLTIITAIGWYYVFYPQSGLGLAHLIGDQSGIRGLTNYLVADGGPITLGFIGAYFFSMQMLLRRYLFADLYPAAFLQATERMLRVFILSLVLTFLADVIVPDAAVPVAAITFMAGIFPREIFHLISSVIYQRLSRLNEAQAPPMVDHVPLVSLDGLSLWTETRLLEERVESVQNMATAPIEKLVVETYFPTAQLVDWVAQAILYSHAGQRGEWFDRLRAVGIRTATDLLDNAGMDLFEINKAGMIDALTGKGHTLSQIVDAVNAAPAATPTRRSGASGGGAAPPQLTVPILRQICDAIWPEMNLPYVVNFLRAPQEVIANGTILIPAAGDQHGAG